MTGLCRSEKTAYPDQTAAEEALAAIRVENQLMGPGRRVPVRAYECSYCGEWHLTSKPLRKGRTP